mmetsp:Transcript_43394/g.94289  ORF Transcript_43394/g.94289 Transcript_43394/m.94289 type:complete len:247 (+) Transcript_43394:2204-2944(+)
MRGYAEHGPVGTNSFSIGSTGRTVFASSCRLSYPRPKGHSATREISSCSGLLALARSSTARAPIPDVRETEGSVVHMKRQETPWAAAAFAASLPDKPLEVASCSAVWLAASVASTMVSPMSNAVVSRFLPFKLLVKGLTLLAAKARSNGVNSKSPDQIRALSRRGSSNSLSKAGEVSSLEAPVKDSTAPMDAAVGTLTVTWAPFRAISRPEGRSRSRTDRSASPGFRARTKPTSLSMLTTSGALDT